MIFPIVMIVLWQFTSVYSRGYPKGRVDLFIGDRLDLLHELRHAAVPWQKHSGLQGMCWLVVWLPWILFSHILGIIIPIDFHIFQRGGPTTNQVSCNQPFEAPIQDLQAKKSLDPVMISLAFQPHWFSWLKLFDAECAWETAKKWMVDWTKNNFINGITMSIIIWRFP